jgi:hypothetical protein
MTTLLGTGEPAPLVRDRPIDTEASILFEGVLWLLHSLPRLAARLPDRRVVLGPAVGKALTRQTSLFGGQTLRSGRSKSNSTTLSIRAPQTRWR